MSTLNRFPLLGLWACEAARRLGYSKSDAEALGHAYAVLFAIRANLRRKEGKPEVHPTERRRKPAAQVAFGGEQIAVAREAGHLVGLVGGDRPQTATTYRRSVAAKFPDGYYERLSKAFARVLKTMPAKQFESNLVYDLYDQWKRQCGVGRLVDLDKLLEWCERRAPAKPAKRSTPTQVAAGATSKRSRKSRASARAAPSKQLLK
ncbi:MAG TPA: hypothetical protein VKE40_03860 [Gemmataceae bacterium]|nr:hypothetical protein [Gemmataceae bacterium]